MNLLKYGGIYHHPISLLSIFGKIFGRVIYNSLFNYFIIDFSHLTNLVFFQEIHVLPNYYQ